MVADPSSQDPCAPLNRIRTTPVSSEISDATNSLLHFSLSPDLRSSPPALNGRKRAPSFRRKSTEDLRIPPGSVRAVGDDSGAGRGGTRNGNGRDAAQGGSTTDSSVQHPFASSPALLRRCNSELDLTAEDGEEEDDFESDEEPFSMRPRSIASSITSHRSSRFGVRIENRSERETNCFAVDAKIKGFYSVGEKAGGFVVFDCEIRTREGTLIKTLKRYSAFVRLREELLLEFPRLKPLIPRLPPKSSLGES